MYTLKINQLETDSAHQKGAALITEETISSDVKKYENIVCKLAISNEKHFFLGGESENLKCLNSRLGSELMRLVKKIEPIARDHEAAEVLSTNPFCKILIGCVRDFQYNMTTFKRRLGRLNARAYVDIANELVANIREEFNNHNLFSLKSRVLSATAYRKKSTSIYIDGLFDRYAKLLAIRLDLGYKKGYFYARDDFFLEDLHEAKQHWSDLYGALQTGMVNGFVGFVESLEYGVLTGFHFHILLFFDGSKVRSDISIGRVIGEYWESTVTKGHGRYFNCNNSQYWHRGVGMISHWESDLRKNLNEKVVEYLIKPDMVIASKAPGERTLSRGMLRETRSVARGRPRSRSQA